MMKSIYYTMLVAMLLGLVISVPDLHAARRKPVVLFDQGHGQAFVIGNSGDLQLSALAGLFREGGFEVEAGAKAITPQLLSRIDCLVISGPFKPFTAEETGAIRNFIKQGGYVSIMIHITPPVLGLLKEFGIFTTNGPINEVRDIIGADAKNFRVSDLRPHPLTKGLRRFSAYGVWGLNPESGSSRIIAKTSPRSWVDLNGDGKFDRGDAAQQFGVIVAGNLGRGGFAVFGDDAIFQNRFLKEDNLLLGKNLVSWMLRGPSRHISL